MEKALDLFTNFLGYSCPEVMSQATLLYFIFTVLRKYPSSQFRFTAHMTYVRTHTRFLFKISPKVKNKQQKTRQPNTMTSQLVNTK